MHSDVVTSPIWVSQPPTQPQTEPRRRGASPLTRRALWLSLVVALCTIGVTLLSAAGEQALLPAPVRAIIIVAATYTLPGLPIAAMLRLPGVALTTVVAGPLSLATTILTGQTQIVLSWWHPIPVQLTVAVAALLLALAGLLTISGPRGPAMRIPRGSWESWKLRLPWLVVAGASFVFFALAVRSFDLEAADATGIITHVGPYYVIALLLINIAVVRLLTSTAIDVPLALVVVAGVVVITSMLTALASNAASFPTAFVHRGLIEILTTAGQLPPPSDARFSWAGFFAGAGQMVEAAGFATADPFLMWAPVVNELTMIAPLLLIGRFISPRPKIAWLGVLIYSYFNWYQQDYFAPQATATFMYTSIVALLLWQYKASRLPTRRISRHRAPSRARFLTVVRRTPGRVWARGPGWTLAVEAVLVVVLAAMVVAHQLTPIVTIASLLIFSVLGATRYRSLWLVALVLFAAWFSFGASDYWIGHIHYLLGDVGQVQSAVGGGVADRLGADPSYQNMQYLRLLTSGVLAIVAVAGWIMIRRQRGWLLIGLLAACPGGLVLVQSYGGEVIIRCFVLSSPFLAPLAACAIARLHRKLIGQRRSRTFAYQPFNAGGAPTPDSSRPQPSRLRYGAVATGATAVLVLLSLVLTANRGLNTSFEYTRKAQERIGSHLLQRAPTDTTIMAWGPSPTVVGPRLFTEVDISRVGSLECLDDLVGCTLDENPDYVFTSDQTRAALMYQYGYPGSRLDNEIKQLLDSGEFTIMYRGNGIVVLKRPNVPSIEVA